MDHETGAGDEFADAIGRLNAAAAEALAAAAWAGGPLEQARAYAVISQVLHPVQVRVGYERGEAVRFRQAQADDPVSLERLGEMLGLDEPLSKARVWQIIRAAEKRRHDRPGG